MRGHHKHIGGFGVLTHGDLEPLGGLLWRLPPQMPVIEPSLDPRSSPGLELIVEGFVPPNLVEARILTHGDLVLARVEQRFRRLALGARQPESGPRQPVAQPAGCSTAGRGQRPRARVAGWRHVRLGVTYQ